MTTANRKGSTDGTTVDTQHTITLTGAQAQIAAAEVHYALGQHLENYAQPWNDQAPLTAAILDDHIAGIEAIVDRFRPVLEQLEAQEVVDWNHAIMAALTRARAAGEDDSNPALDPPTTGDVTLTWTSAGLERLAQQLTDRASFEATSGDREEYDRRWPVGEAIREQLAKAT